MNSTTPLAEDAVDLHGLRPSLTYRKPDAESLELVRLGTPPIRRRIWPLSVRRVWCSCRIVHSLIRSTSSCVSRSCVRS